MLFMNVSCSTGLVNGSIGTVIDLIYATGTQAPALPGYVVVDFPDYTGHAFFAGDDRTRWVPIAPYQFEWDTDKA